MLGELVNGEAYVQPVYPGNELAFVSANGQRIDAAYTVTDERGQVALFDEDGSFSAILDDGRFQAFIDEQNQVAQKPVAGPDELMVSFTNNSQSTLTVTLIPNDPDQASEGLFDIAAGSTEIYPVLAGGKLGFYNFDKEDFDGEFYRVTYAGNQSVSLPYKDPTLVNVTAFNTTQYDITLIEANDDPEAPGEDLVTINPNGQQTVRVRAGKKLQFYDYNNQTFDGGDFVVGNAQNQRVNIPVRQPGSVLVYLNNTTSKTIHASTVIDDPNAEGEYVGSCEPGKTARIYRMPGEHIGFGQEGTEDWLGGFYTVPSSGPQSISLPLKKGDSDGDGIVSQTEIQSIASKIAQDIAAQRIAALNQPSRCWRNSYGRGVGRIPDTCPSGYPNLEAGLCYASCPPGFTGFAATCVRDCPKDFTSDGLFSCYKPAPHTRHTEIWEIGDTLFSLDDARARCLKSRLGKKYGCSTENRNTIVYSNCPGGTQRAPVVTNKCRAICPTDMTDLGLSCYKNNKARGVGRIRNGCSAKRTSSDGKPITDNDAGLCYEQCDKGYNGVGPVCWGYCPRGWVNCGAGCAKDSNECAMMLSDQISSPLMVAGNVALIAVTAGAAAPGTAAANAAKTAGKTAASVATKVAAKTAAKAAIRTQVRNALRAGLSKGAGQAGKAIAKDLAIDTAIAAALGGTITNITTEIGKKQFKDQVRALVIEELEKGISDEQIDAAIEVAMAGADAEDGIEDNFPWETLDPTGVAEVVVAYNMPLCSKIVD